MAVVISIAVWLLPQDLNYSFNGRRSGAEWGRGEGKCQRAVEVDLPCMIVCADMQKQSSARSMVRRLAPLHSDFCLSNLAKTSTHFVCFALRRQHNRLRRKWLPLLVIHFRIGTCGGNRLSLLDRPPPSMLNCWCLHNNYPNTTFNRGRCAHDHWPSNWPWIFFLRRRVLERQNESILISCTAAAQYTHTLSEWGICDEGLVRGRDMRRPLRPRRLSDCFNETRFFLSLSLPSFLLSPIVILHNDT